MTIPVVMVTHGRNQIELTHMTSNYERNHSHTHCWNQGDRPACGITLEKHKQCCLCDTSMTSQTWRDRFNEKFQDCRNGKNSVGLQYVDVPEKSLKDFIQSELSQQRKEIVEEIKENFEDTVCLTDKENNKAFTTICFKGTGKGASLFDIITKLSSEDICQ